MSYMINEPEDDFVIESITDEQKAVFLKRICQITKRHQVEQLQIVEQFSSKVATDIGFAINNFSNKLIDIFTGLIEMCESEEDID